jgi:hypothetical protein
MKKLTLSVLIVALSFVASAHARNDIKEFPVASAMALDDFKTRLSGNVQFYFGDSHGRKIIKTFGKWPSLKKTNAFNKSDEFACQWALLSALISLEKRALSQGGNAVIVITNNDHIENASTDTFECEVGNIVASVALIGTVVTLQ